MQLCHADDQCQMPTQLLELLALELLRELGLESVDGVSFGPKRRKNQKPQEVSTGWTCALSPEQCDVDLRPTPDIRQGPFRTSHVDMAVSDQSESEVNLQIVEVGFLVHDAATDLSDSEALRVRLLGGPPERSPHERQAALEAAQRALGGWWKIGAWPRATKLSRSWRILIFVCLMRRGALRLLRSSYDVAIAVY